MFATLNIAGSNGNITQDDSKTHKQTVFEDNKRHIDAALAWIKETFAEEKSRSAHGVFLLSQANGIEKSNPGHTGLDAVFSAFKQESIRFGKPVILAHGDSHYYLKAKQQISSTNKTEYVTHVKTSNVDDAHWLRVVVKPKSSDVFTMHREIVKKNLEQHSLF